MLEGDGQQADVGLTLPLPVRFRVEDSLGRPVRGVAVELVVTAGDGSVPLSRVMSDSSGVVSTSWTLGLVDGIQLLEARYADVTVASANAKALCNAVDCDSEPVEFDQPFTLTLTTYDSSGQVVHPDVARRGSRYWMAITPYPGSNAGYENPSIFQSGNGKYWRVPSGLANPIARSSTGYLSDPDIVSDDETKLLWLYYRQVADYKNTVFLTQSIDGVHWSPPEVVAEAPNHQLVSPSVVHGSPVAKWLMFGVNSGGWGCTAPASTMLMRTSEDGRHWAAPVATDLEQPGQTIWHVEVTWIPARNEYWALYNTYPNGGNCATNALYLARSNDGLHWTTGPSPIFRAGEVPAFADVIYRSTILVSNDGTRATLWLSGAHMGVGGYMWAAGTVMRHTSDLLARMMTPSTPLRLDAARRALPPPEDY